MARITNPRPSMFTSSNVTISSNDTGFHFTTQIDPTDPHEDKENHMNKKHTEARQSLAEMIKNALGKHDTVRVLTVTEDREGPMGGRSAEVLGYHDDGTDGGLVAFAVNVYADDKIERKVADVADEIKAERERRAEVFGSGDDA